MPEVTVKEAIEALAQHAASTRNPSILAALKHIEAGMEGVHDQRPMDQHDSPGMRAARQHTRPEYHKGGPKKDPKSNEQAKADQAPSPGKQAAQHATNGASSE